MTWITHSLKSAFILELLFPVFVSGLGDTNLVIDSAPAVIEEFDVAQGGGFILLPVTLKGQTYPFILDTGSESTAFDTRLRPHLKGLKKTSRLVAPNGTVRADMFESPDATLGKLKLPTEGFVICTDLSEVRHAIGKEVYGVLGMDFLQAHKFRIDFDHGKVVFLRSIDTTDENLGKPIHVGYKDVRTPYVAAALSLDHVDDFVVDTGASTTGTLTPTYFNDMAQKEMLKIVKQSKVVTVAGNSMRQVGRVQLLAVNGSIVRSPVVKMSDSNLLGLGFWSRYVATFDFPNKVIYLREGARFQEPDRYDLSGLHLLRVNGVTVVHSIDAGSRAAEAGIKSKDVILKINDQEAGQQSMFAIRRILSVECAKVVMKVGRENERFEVVFSTR
jgi:hypothetical protein